MSRRDYDHIAGCLLGGASGDALGAAVEFDTLESIRSRFGADGVSHYAPAYGRVGAITDDTQMTLFTAEGLLRYITHRESGGTDSHIRVVHRAYLRWLATQDGTRSGHAGALDGWLFGQKDLHSRRAPGNACLSSLRSGLAGVIENPINDSKGCGGVMRAAPTGLIDTDLDSFHVGCDIAAITHGHPSGYLAAGFLAQMIEDITDGADLTESLQHSRSVLLGFPRHEECLCAVDAAVAVAREEASPENVARLGEGWVAEEALAISIFCAIKAEDFAHGIRLAVNHSGDSDSTGSITGNILGALWGVSCIPSEFLDGLEMREVVEEIARDIADLGVSGNQMRKYPGS